MMKIKAVIIPKKMMNICCFCVTLTARVPPIRVYKITMNPMSRIKILRFQPKTTLNIIAGAYIVIPAAKPR